MNPKTGTIIPDRRKPWSRLTFSISLVVLIFALGVIIGMVIQNEQAVNQEILNRARSYFNHILLTRKWNAGYGGVWVEKKPGVHSNPWLKDPDLGLPDGRTLTLRNPALMTREISELAEKEGLFKFRITSLLPLNPGNAADDKERQALASFERGEKERSEQTLMDGRKTFWYMAPLPTEQSCLACHAVQGYKIGDVRGGISVRFDVSEIKDSLDLQRNLIILVVLASLGAVLASIVIFIRTMMLKLEAAHERIRRMALTDDLTGLPNRRFFMQRLEAEVQRIRRYKSQGNLLMLDLDFFKAINDKHGHPAGDLVLKEVARRIESAVRKTDLAGRLGGEEFAVLLPETSPDKALTAAEKLRSCISAEPIAIAPESAIAVTVSIGVSNLRSENAARADSELVLKNADDAMYEAKKKGRNTTSLGAEIPVV